jgi:hypothetical protein
MKELDQFTLLLRDKVDYLSDRECKEEAQKKPQS